MFSDETTFYVIKRKNKWRTKDEQWKEDCMEVSAIGGRVNFWSVVISEGTRVAFESIVKTLIVTFIVTLFNSYSAVILNGKK